MITIRTFGEELIFQLLQQGGIFSGQIVLTRFDVVGEHAVRLCRHVPLRGRIIQVRILEHLRGCLQARLRGMGPIKALGRPRLVVKNGLKLPLKL